MVAACGRNVLPAFIAEADVLSLDSRGLELWQVTAAVARPPPNQDVGSQPLNASTDHRLFMCGETMKPQWRPIVCPSMLATWFHRLVWPILRDQRGVMAADYAVLLALACTSLVVAAFHIGDTVSHSIGRIVDFISSEAELVRLGHYD